MSPDDGDATPPMDRIPKTKRGKKPTTLVMNAVKPRPEARPPKKQGELPPNGDDEEDEVEETGDEGSELDECMMPKKDDELWVCATAGGSLVFGSEMHPPAGSRRRSLPR